MIFQNYLLIFMALLLAGGGAFFYFREIRLKRKMQKKADEMNRQMYELAILKELGERAGYSLNVENIVDIIMGSLHQFIEYSAVSYMLLEPEKIIFKVHLEKSVHRNFIDEIRERMLKSLSALLEQDLGKYQLEEILSGAILIENIHDPVQSYFNIPLVIVNKVVGVLTIAHIQAGLYKEEEMTILYKITQQASRAVSRLQEVVETEQGKLNAMVESITEGVVMTDKDYRILVVNPAAKKIVGLENKKDIIIFDFIDNLSGKFDIREKLEESIKLDKILEANNIIIGDQYYQIFVSPVKDINGTKKDEILGGVVIFHDITHEKELERLREDFTSMMVHELRSPLSGIQKMAELIMKRGKTLNKEKLQKEYFPMIYKSSSDMVALVNDLLDVAKIEAGKFSVLKEAGNLKNVVEERIAFFASVAKDAEVSLTARCDSRLPEKLEFDPQRISQVLNNLISNAIKFTLEGGEIIINAFFHEKNNPVAEEARKAGIGFNASESNKAKLSETRDSVIVAIQDNGVGIKKENIDQLFNKFKQFKASMTNENKGTGLGLSIVKGIVEAHEGIVGVASEEGAGSTFYFTIPV